MRIDLGVTPGQFVMLTLQWMWAIKPLMWLLLALFLIKVLEIVISRASARRRARL